MAEKRDDYRVSGCGSDWWVSVPASRLYITGPFISEAEAADWAAANVPVRARVTDPPTNPRRNDVPR